MGSTNSPVRRVLSWAAVLGKVTAKAIARLVALLPASRAKDVLEQLMAVEIEDPSGRAHINRAGLSVGIILFMVFLGMLVKDALVTTVLDGDASPWSLPGLVFSALLCVAHSLVCASMLRE